MVDEKDRKILQILMENARIPIVEIAKKIGLSDVAVKKRILKLEKDGIIRKYTIIVDPEKLGYNSISIVGVDVEPEKLLSVVKELKEKDYVKCLAITTGDHMIVMTVWAENNRKLTEIIQNIGSLEGVKKVCPSIVLEIVKEQL